MSDAGGRFGSLLSYTRASKEFSGKWFANMPTLKRMIDFSLALTLRATSSWVRYKQVLSYVELEPDLASFSRIVASLSGEQKHRYA